MNQLFGNDPTGLAMHPRRDRFFGAVLLARSKPPRERDAVPSAGDVPERGYQTGTGCAGGDDTDPTSRISQSNGWLVPTPRRVT
jgi:hypothetical protein